MKKILLAALMITMVGVGYAQSANRNLVYNYQASIKRLNANFFIGSVVNGTTASQTVAERYSVVSDTIQGYVVIPVCVACNSRGVSNFRVENTPVDVYVTRIGDTLNRRLDRPFVFKTKATYDAGVFGAFVALNTNPASNEPKQSDAEINQAWMSLTIGRLPTSAEIGMVGSENVLVLPTGATMQLRYGFYGLDNSVGGTLWNRGFGTVINTTRIIQGGLGWCDVDPGSRTGCKIIQSITGSTIGDPTYEGPCSATPMWDLCYNGTTNQGSVSQGSVSGTWSLVYDAALSNLADTEKETAILARFGTDINHMFTVPVNVPTQE